MSEDNDRIKELQMENARLLDEVDRYRTATEDALQQIDWCIGYFVGSRQRSIAKSLGANRAYIRRHLLNRAEQNISTDSADEDGD